MSMNTFDKDIKNNKDIDFNIKDIKEKINTERTKAFEKFGNKTQISKYLICTKPCSNVIKTEDGNYSVCYRAECSYAHSLKELKHPHCSFDITCRFRDGKKNKQGVVEEGSECKFLHSDETPEEWMQRINFVVDLPASHENTRKPVIKEQVIKEQVIKEQVNKEQVNKEQVNKEQFNKIENLDNIHIINEQIIIKVPNEEYAKLAIETAINKGIKNIKVEIIE
jgi:hypothetical protein